MESYFLARFGDILNTETQEKKSSKTASWSNQSRSSLRSNEFMRKQRHLPLGLCVMRSREPRPKVPGPGNRPFLLILLFNIYLILPSFISNGVSLPPPLPDHKLPEGKKLNSTLGWLERAGIPSPWVGQADQLSHRARLGGSHGHLGCSPHSNTWKRHRPPLSLSFSPMKWRLCLLAGTLFSELRWGVTSEELGTRLLRFSFLSNHHMMDVDSEGSQW